jgi:ubiquinone/menaquinone biosynthesis C-methylase UbiE
MPDGHPIFAAIYDRMTAPAERTIMRPVRQDVAGGARGRVLEIGCGTGANFSYYTDAATEVYATEPDPHMLARARARVSESRRAIDLRQATAETLPFAGDFFDTVIATLVLCTVEDPAQALREIVRVLRPGGELRFYEHVRYEHALGALAQDLATPLWRALFGGCRPNRDTGRLLREAGLSIVRVEATTPVPPIPPFCFIRPQLRGVARKEAA